MISYFQLIMNNYGQGNPKSNHGTLKTQDKTRLVPPVILKAQS